VRDVERVLSINFALLCFALLCFASTVFAIGKLLKSNRRGTRQNRQSLEFLCIPKI